MSDSLSQLTSQPAKIAWGPKAAIGVSLVAYFASQIVLAIPIMLLALFSHPDVQTTIGDSSWLQLVLAGISAATILLVLGLFLRYRKQGFASLGFKKIRLSDIGWMSLAAVVYIIVLVIVMSVAANIPGFNAEQAQDVGYQGANGWQLVLAFIGLVILPPLAEEMLFRGFLYRGLSAKWPRVIAALFTSALFALVHFQWNVGVDVFILSLILIALYEKTKNLWMCVGLHALKNGVAFLALFIFIS